MSHRKCCMKWVCVGCLIGTMVIPLNDSLKRTCRHQNGKSYNHGKRIAESGESIRRNSTWESHFTTLLIFLARANNFNLRYISWIDTQFLFSRNCILDEKTQRSVMWVIANFSANNQSQSCIWWLQTRHTMLHSHQQKKTWEIDEDILLFLIGESDPRDMTLVDKGLCW